MRGDGELVAKYAAKAIAAGLADEGAPLFESLGGGLVRCVPRDPYRAMIATLAARSEGDIRPEDAEARAFLRAVPVARALEAEELARALAGGRCAVLADGVVVARGAASPEEAFASFSSVCFACYVKFVAVALAAVRGGVVLGAEEGRILALAFDPSHRLPDEAPALARGPFEDEISVRAAVIEAGKATVGLGLVGAHFGNVSYLANGALHISRAGAPLDELEGRIVAVPLGGRGEGARGASSELPTHLRIVEHGGARAVLHAHPRHAVAASLAGCRAAGGAPIVPGAAAPEALAGRRAAIVHGHGVFATGAVDFGEALQSLVDVERRCFDEIARELLRFGLSRRGG